MRSLDPSEVGGHKVIMKTTNPKHISPEANAANNANIPATGAVQSFGNLLMSFVKSVNSDQLGATKMQQLAVTNPNRVNIHQVMNALTKAEMSIGFLKSVTDKTISAFRELSSLR
jgi:flagellar hook-basal body complex protein FliE